MGMNAGDLRRRIQIQRATRTDDGAGNLVPAWSDFGPPIAAARRDISDSERMMAGRWDNNLVTRFTVRANAFAKGIRRDDRILHDGLTFEIDGIKEVPPGTMFLEITAQTEAAP